MAQPAEYGPLGEAKAGGWGEEGQLTAQPAGGVRDLYSGLASPPGARRRLYSSIFRGHRAGPCIANPSGVSAPVRYLTLAIVMTGCSFVSPPESPEVILPSPTPPAAQPCRTDEQGVALCVDFEDKPLFNVATDRSRNANHVAAVDVSPRQRTDNEQAVTLRPTSSLRVPESAALDLPQLTIEMWIFPEQKPPKRVDVGLFDNPGQYTMRLQDNLRIRCGLVGPAQASSASAVPEQQWSHVACRYAAGELRVYVNGHLSECQTAALIPVPSAVGSAIGAELKPGVDLATAEVIDRFIGGIDNVRIYDRALDEAAICAAAGQEAGSCEDECP